MRIALVVNQFPSREHPYIWDWVNELIRQGVDVQILAEKTDFSSNHSFKISDVLSRVRPIGHVPSSTSIVHGLSRNVRTFLQPDAWGHAKRLFNLRSLKYRRKLLRLVEYFPLLTEQFDLIHFNAPQIAIRRFELRALFNCPALVSFRGQDISFHPERYDELLQTADHLHFISEHLLKLAEMRGYSANKHTIIPPMVDTYFYQPSSKIPVREDKGYILFTAARLEWMKGFEFALQAVALLQQQGRNVEYYIAGDGDLKDALLYTTWQLGIQDHVHFLGWLSPEKIREWMWKSDLYILASVDEAFNNSVLQAQSCGVPIVCADAGGLPENIEDGITGLLFHRRDAWDMAQKISTLLMNVQLRQQMSIKARLRAETQYNLNKNVNQFTSMYRAIARG